MTARAATQAPDPRPSVGYAHLFGYELVLLARHHFHLCDTLHEHLSGRGCQRRNFAALGANIVYVLAAVNSDARLSEDQETCQIKNLWACRRDRDTRCYTRQAQSVLL